MCQGMRGQFQRSSNKKSLSLFIIEQLGMKVKQYVRAFSVVLSVRIVSSYFINDDTATSG